MANYTATEILAQLDQCAADFVFPMLDNGYVYPADVRLSAYRDELRWAICIETLGFNPRAGGHNGINNCLHLYGNCLARKPGTANDDFLAVTSDGPEGLTFDDADFVSRNAESITVRERVVRLDLSPVTLRKKGIQPNDEGTLNGADLVRSLLPEYRDSMLATEEELRLRIPADLPIVLRLDEWNHPDLCQGEIPSENRTFKLLADVLVSGDMRRYRPIDPPNTHWSNWPDGGSL